MRIPAIVPPTLSFLASEGVKFLDMQTLVIYDVHDDAQREGLREHLREYGLRRIQYSGFLGELNTHDRLILVKEVGRFLEAKNDSVYVVPLCDRCMKTVKVIASSGEVKMEKSEVDIVP